MRKGLTYHPFDDAENDLLLLGVSFLQSLTVTFLKKSCEKNILIYNFILQKRPVDSPHKVPVMRKTFPWNDVITHGQVMDCLLWISCSICHWILFMIVLDLLLSKCLLIANVFRLWLIPIEKKHSGRMGQIMLVIENTQLINCLKP